MARVPGPLESLYPFAYGGRKDVHAEQAGLLESVRQKAADSAATSQAFFAENGAAIVAASRAIADVYRRGGRLFTMGNGGSSCDAAHVAVEFLHPITAGRPALAAIDLGADTAMLTAVGNDLGFEHVFSRQLDAQARAGDGLIGISTSGRSKNLMNAFLRARQLGLTTVGLTGMDGGAMAGSEALDHCLVVRTDSIHRIQECHVATYHILWDLVHTQLADDRGQIGRRT
jgi:D-sedoheptulose 7-phosphate isomerase